ncbi:MAG: hypothetical protein A4E62_01907 [Syntrophorhabdus sp. PtaU1.Bin002]|nr:MAG: hypothetical protein A4E62_01907 [Syntrophorhabdus sp. PtaU1.Bin002]
MKIEKLLVQLVSLMAIALLVLSGGGPAYSAQQTPSKAFSQQQLDQLLAPVALYPDSLLTQILMASTYPLEVVKAMNWMKQNKGLKGDALTAALEKQDWDPSVKSLVNFPEVLQMMNDQLDWTQQLGDAFLAQRKDVMDTVQKLRGKAQAQGNLKTTKEQKVVVEKETQTIIIEPANPQVVYVPTYNPTVVYGTWWYPAPPVYVYPPPPPYYPAFTFAAGVAVGAAWGYAWGHADWHGGDVDIDVNRNTNINRNINRTTYQQQYQAKGQVNQAGKGTWQHDADHRQGVAYRDNATAQKYGQQPGRSSQARSESRGYSGDRGAPGRQTGSLDGSGGREPAKSGGTGSLDRSGGRESAQARGTGTGGRESAFSGAGNGRFERNASERGQMSRGGRGRR